MINKKIIIMEVGETANGLVITEEMILNSMDTFIYKPIVFNKKENFKNYTNYDLVMEYMSENCIGFISDKIDFKDGKVYANVMILDDYEGIVKDKYDNWCIQLSDDKKSFTLSSVEFF